MLEHLPKGLNMSCTEHKLSNGEGRNANSQYIYIYIYIYALAGCFSQNIFQTLPYAIKMQIIYKFGLKL
jgi:hypothetical protein